MFSRPETNVQKKRQEHKKVFFAKFFGGHMYSTDLIGHNRRTGEP